MDASYSSKKISRKDVKDETTSNGNPLIRKQLNEIEEHLRSRNGALIAMIFLVFIFISVSMFNTYYQLKSHSCLYSSVDKCVAADKFCSSDSGVTSNNNITFEYLTNQEIEIHKDFSKVNDQTVNVDYYKLDSKQNITPSVFPLDFYLKESVPTTGTGIGVSNLLGLGSSTGYYIRTEASPVTEADVVATGISFYLGAFDGLTTLSGSSVGQISYIINQGFSKASEDTSNVVYLDNPLGSHSIGNTKETGIVYIPGNDNNFQIGTFIGNGNAPANINQFGIQSSLSPGTSVIFSNFLKSKTVPYQEIKSYIKATNVTQNIKLSNYRNNNYCNDKKTDGCTCVEPGTQVIEDCKNYYFDDATGTYKKTDGTGASVRFCTYGGTKTEESNGLQLNEPPNYASQLKGTDNNKPTYYFNGYSPGKAPDPSVEKDNRYQLPAIFCSNATTLVRNRTTAGNELYENEDSDILYSSLNKVYNSKQPNYITGATTNVVALGHQAP